MTELENLRWSPHWVSHLGCIQGCLKFHDITVSDAWLYGVTGHAFVLNIHDVVCPSGPTAWRSEVLYRLGRNLGFTIRGVFGPTGEQSLEKTQEMAWQLVKDSIDQGRPCFGWELDIPEYYVIYGCDDEGYFISGPGCDDGKGPKPWRELGRSEIGFVMIASLEPAENADKAKTVREALAFAVEYGRDPGKWTLPNYHGGLKGYDCWIRSLESGTAIAMGMAYNAAVWSECRRLAVDFLTQVRSLPVAAADPALGEAIDCYETVSRSLSAVHQAYPFSPGLDTAPIEADSRRRTAIEALREAQEAEQLGLAALARVVEKFDQSMDS